MNNFQDNSCKEFLELRNSSIVDNRSGCIALIIREEDGQCIESSGPKMKFCPYCGAKIVSEYLHNRWTWRHL